METTLVSQVAELSEQQRLAAESIVGRTLEPDDHLLVAVLRPNREPTAEAKARAREKLKQVFAEIDRRTEGCRVSKQEADTIIDEAISHVRSQGS